MPTTYTHYRFGKDVLNTLPEPLQKSIEKERELFDIGLHGPDILFYYRIFVSNKLNRTGYRMHEIPAAIFLNRAKNMVEQAKDKAAARAYLYGFICHFALDSECHNYVEKIIQVSGISHSEIEMEFDRLLLTIDNIEPVSYLGTKHIHPRKKNAVIIAPFFRGISAKEIKKTLIYMILCHKILLAKHPVKRKLLKGVLNMMRLKERSDMIMSTSPNPKCEKYTELLKRQYDGAISIARDLILNYQNVLLGKDTLSPRFKKTFGAGNDWETLDVE